MFLTFTTTKSGFGNDSKKSLCKFMVGKNLRIVAQWWTLRERHLVRLYFNLQWSYFKKSVLHFKLHESVFEYIYMYHPLFLHFLLEEIYAEEEVVRPHPSISQSRISAVGHVMPI